LRVSRAGDTFDDMFAFLEALDDGEIRDYLQL
jgi:hypothetical protein